MNLLTLYNLKISHNLAPASLLGHSTALDVNIMLNVSDFDSSNQYSRQLASLVTNAGLPAGSQPVISTYQELPKGSTAAFKSGSWGAGGIMIIVSSVFAYMPALFCENMARTRLTGQRVHLFVSSMSRKNFYAGFFVADCVSLLVPLVLTPILMAAFGFKAVLDNNFLAFLLLVVLFAPGAVTFGYFMSWFFSTIEAAQEWGQEVS